MPQEHEAPLAQRLFVRMPDLLNPSHTSCPDREDAATDPSELIDTGGKGAFTQWVHGEFMVSSEAICPPNTHWAHAEYF